MAAARFFRLPALAALACFACGGGAPSAASPDRESGERSGDASDEGGDGEGSSSESRPAPEAVCADGSCVPCGDGLCPDGFFCDESAGGGPACSWLPECADEPSCACVKRALGGSCEEREAGVYFKGD